ncbi:MAG: hypothetical protein ABIK96_13790 [bacterium]
MHHRLFIPLVLLILAATSRAEPVPEPVAPSGERSARIILPVLAYSPDTSLMLGGTFLRFFSLEEQDDLRPSVFSPVLIVTARKQVLAFLGVELNWGQGRHRLEVAPSYILFPDRFYGIGRDAPESAEEEFTPRQLGFQATYDRRIRGPLRAGAGIRLVAHRFEEVEPGGQLSSGAVPGADRSTVVMPRVHVVWDSRDNTWGPTGGSYHQAGSGLARTGLFSDHRFSESFVDLRTYVPAGRGSVLALQAAVTWTGGNPPYYMMPRLGGDRGLRGYLGGRYLDRTMALARIEWRSAELVGRLGIAAFAGIGDVAPEPSRLTLRNRLWSAGFGLRFTLSREEKVKIRADFGSDNGGGGFYLSLGEAF